MLRLVTRFGPETRTNALTAGGHLSYRLPYCEPNGRLTHRRRLLWLAAKRSTRRRTGLPVGAVSNPCYRGTHLGPMSRTVSRCSSPV